MRRDQVIAFTALAAVGFAAMDVGPGASLVHAAPVRRVGPEVFGEVFRACRRSMLRVRTIQEPATFSSGFLLGAAGEFVFGAAERPPQVLGVIGIDGIERTATLLGFDPDLGLAIGRLDRLEGGALDAAPLRPAPRGELALEQWVVILHYDPSGELQPFAGVVESSAKPTAIGKKGQRRTHNVARVAAPGSRGSPVLTLRGELVAVVFEAGSRKTRAVTLESLLPFLRTTILGQ